MGDREVIPNCTSEDQQAGALVSVAAPGGCHGLMVRSESCAASDLRLQFNGLLDARGRKSADNQLAVLESMVYGKGSAR